MLCISDAVYSNHHPEKTANSHASLPCSTQNLKNQHPLLVDYSRIFEGGRQMRPVLIFVFLELFQS